MTDLLRKWEIFFKYQDMSLPRGCTPPAVHAGIHTPAPVNRMTGKTGVKTLPSRNFVCGR